jgi:hypothetical protein
VLDFSATLAEAGLALGWIVFSVDMWKIEKV